MMKDNANDDVLFHGSTEAERDLLRCPTCGVPWELHDETCSRHWYPRRAFLMGGWSAKGMLRSHAATLSQRGWQVRSRYLYYRPEGDPAIERWREIAKQAKHDILCSNTFLYFADDLGLPSAASCLVSLGVAIGHGLEVIWIAPTRPEISWAYLPSVRHFDDWDAFLNFWYPPELTTNGTHQEDEARTNHTPTP